MTDCDYCEESFADEDAYLQHLESEHEGELSAIDRRRVGDTTGDGQSNDTIGIIAIAIVVVGSFAVVGYIAFFSGSAGGSDGPHGTAHEHGTIVVELNGEQLDLLQSSFSMGDRHFHFDSAQDRIEPGRFLWHKHSQDVSLEYGLEALGIDVDADGPALTIDGTTYDDSDPGTDVNIMVDGERVDPVSHKIQGAGDEGNAIEGDGDSIRIEIQTA